MFLYKANPINAGNPDVFYAMRKAQTNILVEES